jgi:transcriptional regulator with XRE-family HTH domain
MEINAEVVKQYRASKGWTQLHLAEACDVSLRTIQRVEKTGAASPETVASLCAVYEIDRSELSTIPDFKSVQLENVYLGNQLLGLAVVGCIGLAVGAGLMFLVIG